MDLFLELLCRYFRLEVRGTENLPRTGPAIVIANHSGWMGLDAALLAYVIRRETGRKSRIMAHHAYFDWSKRLREFSFKQGLRRPNSNEACRTLHDGHVLIVFPEGERGNFKSSAKRYKLQPFHKGFVHIAIETHAPVIPCAILGSEEAQINLGSIRLGLKKSSIRLPLPVFLPPLPSRWRIQFFEPKPSENLESNRASSSPLSAASGVAESIRYELQEKLNELRR